MLGTALSCANVIAAEKSSKRVKAFFNISFYKYYIILNYFAKIVQTEPKKKL
jgi:hypothetical protein